jgi:hypothetical protein
MNSIRFIFVWIVALMLNVCYGQQMPQQYPFDSQQRATLKMVHEVGTEIGQPELLQAIVMQETHAGRHGKVGDLSLKVGQRSYGIAQVKVITARDVLLRNESLAKRYFLDRNIRKLPDEEIIALLIANNRANVEIAADHLNMLIVTLKNIDRATVAYNVGISGVKKLKNIQQYRYLVGVKYFQFQLKSK